MDLRRSVNETVEERALDDSTVFVVSDTTHDASATATTTFYIRDDGDVIRFSQELLRERRSGEIIITSRHLTFEAQPDEGLESPDWIEDAHEATGDEETADG